MPCCTMVPKRTDAPQLATGWNEQVFFRVGALVRQGADTAAILQEAEQWREPGYTEAQTQAEVADMVQRWERHIEDTRDPDYEVVARRRVGVSKPLATGSGN